MRRQLVALAASAVFVSLSGVALAHHSFAMFDADQRTTLSGTVKEFQWVNPHAWIFVMVPNHDGGLEQWAVEMGGPGQIARQGWTAKTLTPGMDVKLTIHPLRDGTNGGQFVGLTLPDGTQFGNPDRDARPAQGGADGPAP
ncbi:MAG TPA: DUF6152 family protein [Xanthobacteraceae bacterium]|jgi:hypothetical protein